MKTLLCLALTFCSIQSARADSIALEYTKAQDVIQSLVMAGVQPVKSKAAFTYKFKDLTCKAYFGGAGSDGEVDSLTWGMTTYNCANPSLTGAKAKLVYDSISAAIPNLEDCGMGKCVVALKNLTCTIDRNAAENEKRFACEVTSAQ